METTTDEKQEAPARSEDVTRELRELRMQLNQLNDQKNALSSERMQVGRKIADLIREAKRMRQDRDRLTTEVRAQKEERDKLNAEIHARIGQVKAASDQAKAIRDKGERRENPHMLTRQIEQLEYKLETEVVDFKEEQSIMKKIKEFKRKLDEAKKMTGTLEMAYGVSKEIDELRNKADAIHGAIQEKAKLSQERHEQLLQISKKIDELRPQEDAIEAKVGEKQKEMDGISSKMGEKLAIVAERDARISASRKEQSENKVAAERKKLGDRQDEVKEKFKTGQTLTTEDLLVLQSMNDVDMVAVMMAKAKSKKPAENAEKAAE